MDENTKLLIEKFATTLGTTVDQLWSVLVGQASLTSISGNIG